MNIQPFEPLWKKQVLKLILAIQQDEFGVGITAADQPDLQNITSYYQTGNGNFGVAIDGNEVVGTIALLDIGHQQVALRKMFVAESYRGREQGVAKKLLHQSHQWAAAMKVTDIYLGTIDVYHAAMRFYEKNGYQNISKTDLPKHFPLVAVDNVFYHRKIN